MTLHYNYFWKVIAMTLKFFETYKEVHWTQTLQSFHFLVYCIAVAAKLQRPALKMGCLRCAEWVLYWCSCGGQPSLVHDEKLFLPWVQQKNSRTVFLLVLSTRSYIAFPVPGFKLVAKVVCTSPLLCVSNLTGLLAQAWWSNVWKHCSCFHVPDMTNVRSNLSQHK